MLFFLFLVAASLNDIKNDFLQPSSSAAAIKIDLVTKVTDEETIKTDDNVIKLDEKTNHEENIKTDVETNKTVEENDDEQHNNIDEKTKKEVCKSYAKSIKSDAPAVEVAKIKRKRSNKKKETEVVVKGNIETTEVLKISKKKFMKKEDGSFSVISPSVDNKTIEEPVVLPSTKVAKKRAQKNNSTKKVDVVDGDGPTSSKKVNKNTTDFVDSANAFNGETTAKRILTVIKSPTINDCTVAPDSSGLFGLVQDICQNFQNDEMTNDCPSSDLQSSSCSIFGECFLENFLSKNMRSPDNIEFHNNDTSMTIGVINSPEYVPSAETNNKYQTANENGTTASSPQYMVGEGEVIKSPELGYDEMFPLAALEASPISVETIKKISTKTTAGKKNDKNNIFPSSSIITEVAEFSSEMNTKKFTPLTNKVTRNLSNILTRKNNIIEINQTLKGSEKEVVCTTIQLQPEDNVTKINTVSNSMVDIKYTISPNNIVSFKLTFGVNSILPRHFIIAKLPRVV